MFITVKYANGQELLVNTNVFSVVLLEYLRDRCLSPTAADPNNASTLAIGSANQLGPRETLDLASETGDLVVELASRGREYARKYLDPKGTYVLIKTYQESEDSPPTYHPLLHNVSEKFKATLNNPKKRKAVVQQQQNMDTQSAASIDASSIGLDQSSSGISAGGASLSSGAGGERSNAGAGTGGNRTRNPSNNVGGNTGGVRTGANAPTAASATAANSTKNAQQQQQQSAQNQPQPNAKQRK